jgi:hypothetical protein
MNKGIKTNIGTKFKFVSSKVEFIEMLKKQTPSYLTLSIAGESTMIYDKRSSKFANLSFTDSHVEISAFPFKIPMIFSAVIFIFIFKTIKTYWSSGSFISYVAIGAFSIILLLLTDLMLNLLTFELFKTRANNWLKEIISLFKKIEKDIQNEKMSHIENEIILLEKTSIENFDSNKLPDELKDVCLIEKSHMGDERGLYFKNKDKYTLLYSQSVYDNGDAKWEDFSFDGYSSFSAQLHYINHTFVVFISSCGSSYTSGGREREHDKSILLKISKDIGHTWIGLGKVTDKSYKNMKTNNPEISSLYVSDN